MQDTRHRITSRSVLILVACLALAAPILRQAQDAALAQVSAAFDLSWHVIGSGGGGMESARYTLQSTAGQPVLGSMEGSGGHTLCSGFWCSTTEYRVYLPLVLRNSP
jgi:hypothetical protein